MQKILFLFLALPALPALSQGSWNIGYIFADSIGQQHVGRQVKVDFKPGYKRRGNPRWIRSYIEWRDTGAIELNGRWVSLLEKRALYADHGSYREQYLKSLDYPGDSVLRIYEAEVLSLKDNVIRLRFQATISAPKKHGDSTVMKRTIEAWIEKSRLDGLMIEE